MYDIVIIGGGIQGVGVAQAAAARGFKTLLLEQAELASGTSSRSSKLIHGGLRYLENAQFSLVKECLRERTLLLKNAPDLVSLKAFFIPVYKNTSRRPSLLFAGLTLYGLLTGLQKSAQFSILKKTLWPTLDGLSSKNLQYVFQYWDAQTDDKLLTQAVMHSALELGAKLLTNATFMSANTDQNIWKIVYQHNGENQEIESRSLVNTAGPWINQVSQKIRPKPQTHAIDLVKGSHIILKGHLTKGIYYLEAPQDKRAIFAMPWYGKILLGTTEKEFTGDPASVSASLAEKEYLLTTFKHYFPEYQQWHTDQIDTSFAGLRVLPANGNNPFSKPRETMIKIQSKNTPPLLSIYGGKLTVYRATAEQAMQRLEKHLPNRKCRANTATLKLTRVE